MLGTFLRLRPILDVGIEDDKDGLIVTDEVRHLVITIGFGVTTIVNVTTETVVGVYVTFENVVTNLKEVDVDEDTTVLVNKRYQLN